MNKLNHINVINQLRKNKKKQYLKIINLYKLMLTLFGISIGANAYLTYRIFVNNRSPLQLLQDQYQAPNLNDYFNQSCQDKFNYLYDDSKIDDGTHVADDNSQVHQCETDITSIRCYPICHNGLVSEEDSDCQDLHRSIQYQRCYPARTVPPYLGGLSLVVFILIFLAYFVKSSSEYPQVFNELNIDDETQKFILSIPNTGLSEQDLSHKNINDTIRKIIQYKGSLFSRPLNKNFRKFVEHKESEELISIRIAR